MRTIIAIFSLIMLSCAASTSSTESTSKIEFTTIKADSYSGFQEPQNKVIKTNDWFSKIWDTAHAQIIEEKPIAPSIDFGENQVILVALGMKNNGGFGIEVSKVEASKNEIIVHYNKTVNGPKCMTTQAIVFPYELITIPKSDKKVVFKSHEKTINCP